MKRLFVFLVLLFVPFNLSAEAGIIAIGDSFPEINLEKPLGSDAASYLGIPEGVGFSLSHVNADLVVVELLSVYCLHCQEQVKHFNKLQKLIEDNPETRGRIKLLGIAVASKSPEVERFIERFQVGYPVVTDPEFKLYHALGAGVTPFSVYVRQTVHGQAGVVAGTHTGLNEDYQKLFAELRLLSSSVVDELRVRRQEAATVSQNTKAIMSDEKLQQRVETAFARTGGEIQSFSQLKLPSGRNVYKAQILKGGTSWPLFAEVVSRFSICDICHDVHFIYLFNAQGRIIAFEPLQLTKWGNEKWTSEDILKMRRRLIGSDMNSPPSFDAEVDAISSATITSAVIFDGINQGKSLLPELTDGGHLKN
jgi:hypothetical protein